MRPDRNDAERAEGAEVAAVIALAEFKVEVEKRFGRVEKLILAVGCAVAVPKLGGPSVPDVVASLITALTF